VGLVGAGCMCEADRAALRALNEPAPPMPEAQQVAWTRPLHFEPAPNDTVNRAAAVSPALSSACAASSDDPVTDGEESQERAEVIEGRRSPERIGAALKARIDACAPEVDALFKAGRAVAKPAAPAADALAPNTALPSQMRAVMLAALHVRRLAADAARRDEAVERCLDLFAFARDSVVAREPVLAPALLFAPSIANVCAAATQGASPAGRARAEAGLAAIEAGVPDARWLSQASPPRAASVRLVSRLRTLLEFLRAGLVARRFHEANSRWPSAAELGDSVPQDARSGTTTVVEASGRDWVLRGAAPAEVRGTDGAFEGDFVVTRWDENDAVTLTVTPDGRSPRAGAL